MNHWWIGKTERSLQLPGVEWGKWGGEGGERRDLCKDGWMSRPYKFFPVEFINLCSKWNPMRVILFCFCFGFGFAFFVLQLWSKTIYGRWIYNIPQRLIAVILSNFKYLVFFSGIKCLKEGLFRVSWYSNILYYIMTMENLSDIKKWVMVLEASNVGLICNLKSYKINSFEAHELKSLFFDHVLLGEKIGSAVS